MNNKKTKLLIGIAVVVLLPLFSFLLVGKLAKGKIVIPKHYGNYYVDTSYNKDVGLVLDTVYEPLKDLTLTNHWEETFSLNKDLKSKLLIINFFDTKDSQYSATLAGNMNLVQKSLTKHPEWAQFISISAQPKTDNVLSIRLFADNHQGNNPYWWVATGDSTKIFDYAINELKIPLAKDGQLNRSSYSQIVLVDTFRHIRGYYDGTDTMQLKNLLNDLVVITMEKLKK